MVDGNPIALCRERLQQIAAQRSITPRMAIDVLATNQNDYSLYVAAQQHWANTKGATRSGRKTVDGFIEELTRG
jgi:hypothetical protein